MKTQIKPFGIGRNLDYIKENFIIMFKTIVEYKVNFYSMLIDVFFWVFTQFILIYLISSNFGNVINWGFEDFVLLLILVNVIFTVIGIFNWGQILFYVIKEGRLNILLIKPINIFTKFYFYDLEGTGFIFFFLSFSYSFFILLYFKLQLTNILLGLFLTGITIITFTLFWLALDSFNLFKLGSSTIFNPIARISDMLHFYPSQFFISTKFRYLLNLIPVYFLSSLLVPIFRNHPNSNLSIQIYLLFSVLLFSILIIIFNWHYGLKKYEAYG